MFNTVYRPFLCSKIDKIPTNNISSLFLRSNPCYLLWVSPKVKNFTS